MHPIYNVKFMVSLFFLIAVILSVILFLDTSEPKTTESLPQNQVKQRQHVIRAKPKPVAPKIRERIVHVDLKGAPLKTEYFAQFFPLIKRLGATGVLLEYDDTFPYKGALLKNVPALNSYKRKDIKAINNMAEQNQLTVIPFVQTLGNLEFLLKLHEFIEYREVPDFPSTICPSYKNTTVVLQDMIEQILTLHPNSTRIHIGCNEVSFLGHCELCTNRMRAQEISKSELFQQHIDTVVGIIQRKRPSMEVLLWDDHFRLMDAEELMVKKSFKPVVWWYGRDVYDELGPGLWKVYSEMFGNVWIASSFKGSTGSNKYITDLNHHLQNHKSWLSIIKEYQNKINFEGIILTGWQRYDHFSVLCELLPVGIPALAMSLRLLQGYKDPGLGPPLEVAHILECQQPYGLIGSAFGSPKCKFPEDSTVKGWLSDYNRKYAFSNPQQVKRLSGPLEKIKLEVDDLKTKLSESLLEVYDHYTVEEWLDTYVAPLANQIDSLWDTNVKILQRKSWPRRPLNYKNNL
ncbi:hexosaminidase D-like isoform X2 [Anthonomus grandis grandis]|uniref:hexosaminidase D-like isoform X2 n=1 Tax=Anthonomus grandis grandis TaxID=2921223 RepID=UPI0021665059|nr:hexosaminidase D-like isoform X2 [Anthonomus grandis grandis]